ncbi:molybdopterin-dependent oxidoreductase Mo/Fe-S-binding subunit [bacterium]|nr:molybdopterin-dependent oxidoreductase Mo/Fe-S-binding subunit [bacterium]
MEVRFKLNGRQQKVITSPGENARLLLQKLGIRSVRKIEEPSGFPGGDIILLDKKAVSAGLLVAAQLDGHVVKTIESLHKNGKLSPVQSALVKVGVVQSAYNAPAAALILTELLSRKPDPNRNDIVDALSCIFIRDTGYEQYFKAVEIAKEWIKDPDFQPQITREFREDLRIIGKLHPKVDGPQLVMGKRAYVEDIVLPGSLILKMLRSPYAHAYISHIDTAEAESTPGVEMVITYKNCPDVYFTTAGQGYPEPSPHDRKMFGQKVRHVGDRVAAVVAESEEIAEKALSKIKVDYEILPPVFTIDDAEAEGASVVHNSDISYISEAPDNLEAYNRQIDKRDGKIIYPFPIGADPHKNLASSVSNGIGDTKKGFEEADVIIERDYKTSQVHCTPCEPHTVYTRMEGDRLVVHASTQVPWHVRRNIAKVLGISENKIRVHKERVGGGYGAKQDILLEDVAAFATWKTDRPVFYQFTRQEEFIASSSRHPMDIKVKLGAKKDGTLTAIDMKVRANTGPYGNHCLTVPMNACSKSLPLIMCPNMSFDVRVFYSNIFPTGAYQGYGAPQGSFALQTALGELAAELKVNHAELIEKNRVREGSVLEILKCLGEGQEGNVVEVASCGLGSALKKGLKSIEYGKKEESDNPDIKIGKGMAIVQQGSGLPGLDQSNARVTLVSDGSLIVHTGGADIGTGLDTVCAKIAAETLCIEMSRTTVISGDTDNTPFDTGAYASSGTYFSGNAVKKASEELKSAILKRAAEILKEPVKNLVLEYPGMVKSIKKSMSFYEIAHNSESGTGSGQLVGHASYTTHDTALPYGAHFCQVAINTRTGKIKVQRYHAYMDCGTPINPEMAEGQVYGGILKSIGHTLWEEMRMDEKGICLNPDLKSYGVPMIRDIPDDFKVEFIPTDDPYGPYGGKSISEVSTNGAACVIAIAIHDAVGVWMREWPFTAEKLLKAMGKIKSNE